MASCCHPAHTGSPPTPLGWLRFATAVVLTGLIMQLSLGVNASAPSGQLRWILHGLLAAGSLTVVFLLGRSIFLQPARPVGGPAFTLENLFLLAIFGAFAVSLLGTLRGSGPVYYEVVATLVTIYAFGQILVGRQQKRAASSLQAMLAAINTATALSCCGQRKDVPVDSLTEGDRIVAQQGRLIPVDGVVEEGSAYVQEISLNGEPFPTAKSPGDSVAAGTRPLDGELILRITRASSDRDIVRLSERLERDLAASRWRTEADRWMARFVPAVAALSLLTFLGWGLSGQWEAAVRQALAVLLISCPCGLGVGLPTALWASTTRLATLGISPGSPDLLERLAACNWIVFDKTGTLTEQELTLLRLRVQPGFEEATLLSWIAVIQAHSDHPVARPFHHLLSDAAVQKSCRLLKLGILPGRGIEADIATVDGPRQLLLGNGRLLGETPLPARGTISAPSKSSSRELLVFVDGKLAAVAELTETLRPQMGGLTRSLAERSLPWSIMTGDTLMDRSLLPLSVPVFAAMTPAGKAEAVQTLEQNHHRVLFIGDGLNDTEAMATATCSIALEGGSRSACEIAHASLPPEALEQIPIILDIARDCRTTIRHILLFAIGYNLLGVTAAASGALSPALAAILMFASSLTVLTVAVRPSSSTPKSIKCSN